MVLPSHHISIMFPGGSTVGDHVSRAKSGQRGHRELPVVIPGEETTEIQEPACGSEVERIQFLFAEDEEAKKV